MPLLPRWRSLACGFLCAATACATSVPRISFEELTDRSEVIAQGTIARSWSDWDSAHKYIWTHHELTVSAAWKGRPGATVIISEPGGVTNGIGMVIAGSVAYQSGDRVLVFLERMPNGYLRTTGWGQGQYRIDVRGVVHASESLKSVDIVPEGASLTSLEGHSLTEIVGRLVARLRMKPGVARGAIQ